ncbi:MAG: glycosyltransferase [Verrucomicrobiota bacterium]
MKDPRPVIACYCSTFLARDMQHIYRQVVGLNSFKPSVITRRRSNADLFPLHDKWVTVIRKSRLRAFRRFYFQKVRKEPVPLTDRETRDLFYAFQKHESRVLHVYFGNTAIELLPFLKATPWPVVVSFHGADAGVDTDNPVYRERLLEVFPTADLVLGRSESLLKKLRDLGCPEEKLRLHRTAIPVEEITFTQRQAPSDGVWRFFQACRLIDKKGIPTTLRAFKTIAEKFPRSSLTIAGDGPMDGELRSLAGELGLAEKVTFRGFLPFEDWSAEAADTHFFLHPSQTSKDGNVEGVPNAMLEAMASGLPVGATVHSGIPEAVDDGVSGILVPERDHEALVRRLLEVMGHPDKYRQMSAAAREAVVERFDHARQIEALEGHYDEAIQRRGQRGRS